MNTSGIRPIEYKVLVKPVEVEAQTKGGLYLPDTEVERSEYARTEGDLVAVSPLAFDYGDYQGSQPKVGDRVIFAKYNAQEITGSDGCKYWLMNDKSIEAVKE